MTAEIAIANPSGVALAADSAVTIGSKSEQKVYNTVNKIFRLCDEEPVGCMIHNAATYSFSPWETLFKNYRKHHGHVRRDTLVEYADDFLDFITNHVTLPNIGPTTLLHDVYDIIVEVGNSLEQWAADTYAASKSAPLTPTKVVKQAIEILEEFVEEIRSNQLLDGLGDNTTFPSIESDTFKAHVKDLAGEVLGAELLSDMFVALLVDAAREVARRGIPDTPTSGVVIAGFGVEELFPCIASFNILTPIDGTIRRHPMRIYKCEPGNDAIVIPYAQTDVVKLFMDGISPPLQKYLEGRIGETINEVSDAVFDALVTETDEIKKSKIKETIDKGTAKVIENLAKATQRWQRDNISGPVVEAVRHLPLDELASLAESMVKNTALRRRVSFDLETVGGPVDVAVISKGDGLVWMERKHYFRPALNSHFFAREHRITAE